MFKFRFKLTDEDYIAFNTHHFFNSPVNKKNLLMFRLCIPLTFVSGVVLVANGTGASSLSRILFIVFLIASVLWLVFFKTIVEWLIKQSVKSMKKSGKLPYAYDVKLEFEDDCILETSERGELKTNYSTVERVETTDDAIYIYIGVVQAIILPGFAFKSGKRREELLSFIEQKRGGIAQ